MKLPVPAPQIADLLKGGLNAESLLMLRTNPEINGAYEHWDRLRHLVPPAGISRNEWWAAIKATRHGLARPLPLHDKHGDAFLVSTTSGILKQLHFLDREAARLILSAYQDDEDSIRRRQLVRSLVEEAMTSSQLEGASVTRRAAKEMLQAGREPRDRSEQMIFNNYATMQSLGGLRDRPLTIEMILEIHRRLMHDTSDNPLEAGQLRTSADDIVVQDRDPTIILHVPPSASELPTRLQALCDFANGRNDDGFLHPIVRAIAIHFQVGYDHPFRDGNGRTARALFYWSMLRSGYMLSEYISISSILKKAPSRYIRAYLHTESDGADMTYFVAHQLDVMAKAVHNLLDYLESKRAKQR